MNGRMHKVLSCVVLAVALAWLGNIHPARTATPPQTKFVTVGTGGVTGVYYPAGGAICRMVNRKHKDHGIRCSVESTGGSEYNVNAIRQGDLDIGVVQSDFQYHAWNGTSFSFKPYGPFKGLRSLFSLHSEPFTIVSRKDANIKTFDDLKGKRVNIGNPGSGSLGIMDVLMKKKGWTRDVFASASQLKASEQGEALCNGKIDAFVYAAGHPNGLLQEASSTCATRIVTVDGAEVDALISENPFYVKTAIPGGMYNGNQKDVKSFGVLATLVTSADTDAETVYQLVKGVFDNLEDFKTLHPVFSSLNKEDMMSKGLTAPLHKGAKRFYCEEGLLEGPVCENLDVVTQPAGAAPKQQEAEIPEESKPQEDAGGTAKATTGAGDAGGEKND